MVAAAIDAVALASSDDSALSSVVSLSKANRYNPANATEASAMALSVLAELLLPRNNLIASSKNLMALFFASALSLSLPSSPDDITNTCL